MRVLVTGGAGFLGSHLCDLLITRSHTVVCLDDLSTGCRTNIDHLGTSPKFSFIEASVLDPVDIAGRFDGVIHLASPASPSAYLDRPIFTLRTAAQCFADESNLSFEQGVQSRPRHLSPPQHVRHEVDF